MSQGCNSLNSCPPPRRLYARWSPACVCASPQQSVSVSHSSVRADTSRHFTLPVALIIGGYKCVHWYVERIFTTEINIAYLAHALTHACAHEEEEGFIFSMLDQLEIINFCDWIRKSQKTLSIKCTLTVNCMFFVKHINSLLSILYSTAISHVLLILF